MRSPSVAESRKIYEYAIKECGPDPDRPIIRRARAAICAGHPSGEPPLFVVQEDVDRVSFKVTEYGRQALLPPDIDQLNADLSPSRPIIQQRKWGQSCLRISRRCRWVQRNRRLRWHSRCPCLLGRVGKIVGRPSRLHARSWARNNRMQHRGRSPTHHVDQCDVVADSPS